MGKADRMIVLAGAALLGLFLPVDNVYSFFLALVLAGLMITPVQRERATYRDLRVNR